MSYASRFVMNSDFASFKSEGRTILRLTLPNKINITQNDKAKVYKTSIKCGSNRASAFRCLIRSNTSKSGIYTASPSIFIKAKENGYEAPLQANVYQKDGEIVLEVIVTPPGYGNSTWDTGGQRITAEVQTYTDPFSRN